MLEAFAAVIRALDAKGVRFLVAGGLAVVAHGYLRGTKDIDLVIELVPQNIVEAFAALESVGYKPVVPVTARQFADADQRAAWIRDKGMQVLNFWSDAHRDMSVDVFVAEPFPFEAEYRQALVKPLQNEIPVRFVTIPTLIHMKEAANRPQDRIDIDNLRLRLPDGGEN
jgi:hypothetical protein